MPEFSKVRVRRGSVLVGKHELEGDDLLVLYDCSNPRGEHERAVFVGASGERALRSLILSDVLMEEDIMTPLHELKERLDDEIAKKVKPDSRVPLDRDPVPGPFEELVRDYYERLGSGE